MATVNLGSIKFKWKGTYNGATAYTVDDVVSYNGSSYICIANSTGNLPTDTSYFEQMSSAGTNGTNGTDLTTTLTTQGDLVYRDGSGLQRLGAGTAGQVLQTGGAAANPSWTTPATGGAISSHNQSQVGLFTTTSTSYVNFTTPFTYTVTPASTSSKFLLLLSAHWNAVGGYMQGTFFRDSTNVAGAGNQIWHGSLSGGWSQGAMSFLDAPNTTSSITYTVQVKSNNGASVYISDGNNHSRTFQVIEL